MPLLMPRSKKIVKPKNTQLDKVSSHGRERIRDKSRNQMFLDLSKKKKTFKEG